MFYTLTHKFLVRNIVVILIVTDLVSDYFCALFQPSILKAVLDIVSEYIPDLEALNLDGNKLQTIQYLNILNRKFLKLKILYIGDNKVCNLS